MTRSDQDLLLDPDLRNWVLLPILMIMILVGIIRNDVSFLIQSHPRKIDKKAVREQQILARSQLLRKNGACLDSKSFDQQSKSLIEALRSKAYLKDPESANQPQNITDLGNLEHMTQMMQGNMIMLIPNMILMAYINHFFSGFILLKLPFPLTVRFKQMLQSGIPTPDLDTQWVSSLSWYFLNVFGLKPVYELILGTYNNQDVYTPIEPVKQQSEVSYTTVKPLHTLSPQGLRMPGKDPHEMLINEADNLTIYAHDKSVLIEAPRRLVEKCSN